MHPLRPRSTAVDISNSKLVLVTVLPSLTEIVSHLVWALHLGLALSRGLRRRRFKPRVGWRESVYVAAATAADCSGSAR